MDKDVFLITVDTEADDAWETPERLDFENLGEIPRFQDLCERFGILPTYLVTYECGTREESVTKLKPIAEAGKCEIGFHLHSWTTPPFQVEDPQGIDRPWLGAYQWELPKSLFEEKAEVLRDALSTTFGIQPTSHRAGRWGIDQRSVDWLVKNDFIVDSSVMPLFSFPKSKGNPTPGPSFFSSPRFPFYLRSQEMKETEESPSRGMLEIPVTVGIPKNPLAKLLAAYLKRRLPARAAVNRLFEKAGGPLALRPKPSYSSDLLLSLLDNQRNRGPRVLNMMIHSSELALGKSPFSRTADDHRRVWTYIEETFKSVKNRKMDSLTLTDAARKIDVGTKNVYDVLRISSTH